MLEPARAWWRRKRRAAHCRRMVYSARERCECGAGLAYWSTGQGWDCSRILTGEALLAAGERGACDHSPRRSFFEVVSERSPAAGGASTRPAV